MKIDFSLSKRFRIETLPLMTLMGTDWVGKQGPGKKIKATIHTDPSGPIGFRHNLENRGWKFWVRKLKEMKEQILNKTKQFPAGFSRLPVAIIPALDKTTQSSCRFNFKPNTTCKRRPQIA